MSLRTRLLLLSLLTLGLPWAGCQYAREMERALRVGQEEALLTTARTLSHVVAADPALLYRDAAMRTEFDVQKRDYFAPLLPTRPLLDGYADEWPAPTTTTSDVRVGVISRTLYLYGQFGPAGDSAAEPKDLSLIVLTRDVEGAEHAWAAQANGPGPVSAYPVAVGAPWAPLGPTETRISGTARSVERGFAIELRLPLRLLGVRLAVFVVDDRGRTVAGTARLGWLHVASPDLESQLAALTAPRMRLSVVDVHGLLLARAGSLAPDSDAHLREVRSEEGWRAALYRRLLARPETAAPPNRVPVAIVGEPVDSALEGRDDAVWLAAAHGDPSMVRAAATLTAQGQRLGALIIEQPAERVLLLRDAALARLLDVTLGVSLVTVLAVTLFSAWLGIRLRRLARAAETALTPEGRLAPDLPERTAADELGALARSFDALLGRVQEYHSYLKSLASKLSHELRTPLTIVSSSLDNLESAQIDSEHRIYLARAREGATRLQRILNAMSEATRVEQSVLETERVRFDLAALVREVGSAYRASFGIDRVTVRVVSTPVFISGSPELIAQMLDKLVDNANDFCPPGGAIEIGLTAAASSRRVYVRNPGPPLPAELAHTLFDSMTAARAARSDTPHLGLGLYIAKLIATFHGAEIAARNLDNGSGVIFEVEWSGDLIADPPPPSECDVRAHGAQAAGAGDVK